MAMCGAEQEWEPGNSPAIVCELEAGHDGPHVCTYEWESTPPSSAPAVPMAPGYELALLERFGSYSRREHITYAPNRADRRRR